MSAARLASRRLAIRVIVAVMLALTALTVTSWQPVAVWLIAMAGVTGLEGWSGRRTSGGGGGSVSVTASLSRVLVSLLFAMAAWELIVRGGPGARLIAFSAMASSIVYVLMAHYRSPLVLLASIAPYFAVIGIVSSNTARTTWGSGQPLVVISAAFPITIFALLLWSARDQLVQSWNELMSAHQAAEERELAAASANRAKSQFLTMMSHEFRTPLNGVLGMAQAMSHEQLSSAQRERLKVIRRSGENLLSILNDLLDLSKIEANSLELEVSEFDLEHLVRGVVAAFAPVADRNGVAFDLVIDEGARGRCLGDARLVRRVLYCLADNAVKFTGRGRIAIRVEREERDIVFQVIDSGIGISNAHQTRLFENFYQVDGTAGRRFGGAGVGLALSRQITQRMGGTLTVDSELDKGSTFTLRLTLPPNAATSSAPPCNPDRRSKGTQLRVLAAEDNPTNQLVLKTLLMQVGVTPKLVATGSEALEAWEAQDWDIILMDIQMPQMDGETATRHIREREVLTGRARTPIVAVTANVMIDQVARYRSVGIDAVVPKPIELRTLLTAMDEALNEIEQGGDRPQPSRTIRSTINGEAKVG